MAIEDRAPLHTFADRAMRDALQYPQHLRPLLGRVLPDVVDDLDFDRMREVRRELRTEDWRGRETDVLYEIPYRLEDGSERIAIVCVLIEHQTGLDRLMPLRTLIGAVLYWDRQWSESEEGPPTGEPLELNNVIPIVFHTGPRTWGSTRQFRELLAPPTALQGLAPQWEPMIWSLADESIEDLLGSESEWMRMLAVVRAETADRETFHDVLERVTRSLEEVYRNSPPRWYDLMKICVTWAIWRRPREERDHVTQLTDSIQADLDWNKELKNMGQTIAEAIYEEGEQKGLEKGREEGALLMLRNSLITLGTKKWQAPSQEVREHIESLSDLTQLQDLLARLLTASSWEELLAEDA